MKRGRPKKAEEEKMIAAIKVRVTTPEKAIVEKRAKDAGVTVCEWIRRQILGPS